jgi:DNA repair ATPase RecN
VPEIKIYHARTQEKLNLLLKADTEIESIQNLLTALIDENNRLCTLLTSHRQEAALKLEKAMTKELRSLNMAQAVFHCAISKQERGKSGCDRIEFYFSPKSRSLSEIVPAEANCRA